jgi:hypothetical protein
MKNHRLIFREDWAEIPAARPITQEHVVNTNLILGLHGPGQHELKKSHHEELLNDPYYIWSGKCSGNWALSFRHADYLINFDLGGLVKWRTKQSGTRKLHVIVKQFNGPWFVGRDATGPSSDWTVSEIDITSTTWIAMDIDKVEPIGKPISMPMSTIDAIGFSDLCSGEGSNNCSRIDWIEVWANAIPRPGRNNQ